MKPKSNWSGVHRFTPRAHHMPTSESEVRDIVLEARRRGESVKVVGAGHSWSDAACTDGQLLCLNAMNRVLSVDAARHQLTVQAGMRLCALNRALVARGLAMSVLGSVAEQSVAGAISTGTHGTGVGFGNLSAAVKALRMVTADGETIDIDASEPELLSAARIGIGALGVITAVTLQCEPRFQLREQVTIVDFDEAMANLPAITAAGEHVKLWWLPHTANVRISTLDRTAARPERPGALTRLARRGVSRLLNRNLGPGGVTEQLDRLLNIHVLPAVLNASRRRPELTPSINRAISAAHFRPGERVDRSDRVFLLTMPPIHREIEYGLPIECAAEALLATRTLIEDKGLFVNFIAEMRFVAADDIMLSGAYQRTSCQLGAYIGECDSRAAYFRGFEKLCLAMGGRPHWGKEFSATSAQLGEVIPRFDDFRRVRDRLDPDDTFDNAFLSRVFA